MDYRQFFQEYVKAYNEALQGRLDTDLIRSFFTDHFLAAGPDSVKTGNNGLIFSFVLKRAYSFYRKIGTRELLLRNLVITPIDEHHDMVKVYYHAFYVQKTGTEKALDFDVTYLLQKPAGKNAENLKPKIFAFISGDEMQAYKDADLI